MHLWNEYEGRTIAGAYTLGRLLRSEGRNGFFSTSDNTGHSAVIRLTEAHFDEEEQLNRWNQVAGVHQDNLIEIERVGKTTFDGVPLTYALMEPEDANLGDVLKERPLTGAETTQVAKSVVAALSALHANGLVHEHVEPANVLAVGEVVKLRSDCVRECIADVEFNTPEGCADLRRRDVHDFGVLLLQCLTLEKEWAPGTNVPEPFNRLIPRALDGSWSIQQIASFLDPTAALAKPTPAANSVVPGAAPSAAGTVSATAAVSQPVRPAATAARVEQNVAAEPELKREPFISERARRYTEQPETSGFSKNTLWAVCIAAAVIIALLAWHFLGAKPAQPVSTAPASPAPPSRQAPAPGVQTATPAVARPVAAGPVASGPVAATSHTTAAPRAGWYVIAYTYNHEGQAQTKADRIAKRHSGLEPEVFRPSEHSPFLVSLGGPMSEAEARAMWQRARRSGMPRDTFVRRY